MATEKGRFRWFQEIYISLFFYKSFMVLYCIPHNFRAHWKIFVFSIKKDVIPANQEVFEIAGRFSGCNLCRPEPQTSRRGIPE